MIPLDICRVIGDGIRNTKVNQFQLSLYKDEVGWLQIRMHDFLLMDDVDSLEHLGELYQHIRAG